VKRNYVKVYSTIDGKGIGTRRTVFTVPRLGRDWSIPRCPAKPGPKEERLIRAPAGDDGGIKGQIW